MESNLLPASPGSARKRSRIHVSTAPSPMKKKRAHLELPSSHKKIKVHTAQHRSRTAKSAQRQSPQRRATAKDQTSRPGSMYNPISTGRSLRIYSSSSSTNVIVDKADTNETIEMTQKQYDQIATITYGEQETPGSSSSLELDVLKAVLLRENYVKRLFDAFKSNSFNLEHLVDIMDMLRIASVEVVEAIVLWRKHQSKPHPFIWNGINYLLKMPSDLDFIQEWKEILHWLEFQMRRNPFILPINLDENQKANLSLFHDSTTLHKKDPHDMDIRRNHRIRTSTAKQFVRVGSSSNASHKSTTAQGRKRPSISRDVTPYSSTGVDSRSSSRSKSSAPIPSIVGELDILRVRKAEKVILSEEEIHGRYCRNDLGRLVPEAIAQQDTKNKDILLSMKSIEMKTSWTSRNDSEVMLKNDSSTFSTQRANRQAGTLSSITKTATLGRYRAPLKRSQGTVIEEEMQAVKRENLKLIEDIIKLKETLKKVEAENNANTDDSKKIRKDGEGDSHDLKNMLSEKEELLRIKQLELNRREEAMSAFKHLQKNELDQARYATLFPESSNSNSNPDSPIFLPHLNPNNADAASEHYEDQAATVIQKRIRGLETRKWFSRHKVQLHRAAIKIQALARGWLSRRWVIIYHQQIEAARVIQRVCRGMWGRRVSLARRLARRQCQAATSIQSIVRRNIGTRRVRHKREFEAAVQSLRLAASAISCEDLKSLGTKCRSSTVSSSSPASFRHSSLLGLLECIVSCTTTAGTTGTTDNNSTSSSSTLNSNSQSQRSWDVVGKYCRRSQRLVRRLNLIAAVAGSQLLVEPKVALALMAAYAHDPSFSRKTFLSLGKTPAHLHTWLQSLCMCLEYQHEFLLLPSSLNLDSNEDMIEDETCTFEEARESQQFIRDDWLQTQGPTRQRPVLLVVSRDLPHVLKEQMIAFIMSKFPGMFIYINVKDPSLTDLENILKVGRSIIVNMDIGLGQAQRRIFLGTLKAFKAALRPAPLCILLYGSMTNRGVDIHNRRIGVHVEELAIMKDGEAKKKLEIAASALDVLLSKDDAEFKSLCDEKPIPEFVHVLEAMMILLSPDTKFSARPLLSNITSSVSWQLSQSFLRNPGELGHKLRSLKINAVPVDNFRALQTYLAHPLWPKSASLTSTLMWKLSQWIEASTQYLEIMFSPEKGEGPAVAPLSRHHPPGLFSSVVEVFEKSEQSLDCSRVLSMILEDVRVFRQSRKINDTLCQISVYRESQQFFFSLYCPETSREQFASIHDSQVNDLLAPNSMEDSADLLDSSTDVDSAVMKTLKKKSSNPRRRPRDPPTSAAELYERLSRLCVLGHRTKALEIQRERIRLTRESRRISGHLVTLTSSELAKAHVLIEMYVPRQASTQRLMVGDQQLNALAALCGSSSSSTSSSSLLGNNNNWEKECFESKIVTSFLSPLLDRIQVTRIQSTQSSCVCPDIRLSIRKRGPPGRMIWRKVGRRNTHRYVFTLWEVSHTRELLLQVYHPASSQRWDSRLTWTERCQLFGTEAHLTLRFADKLWARLKRVRQCSPNIFKWTIKKHMERFALRLAKDEDILSQDIIPLTLVQMESRGVGQIRCRTYLPESSDEFHLIMPDSIKVWSRAQLRSDFVQHLKWNHFKEQVLFSPSTSTSSTIIAERQTRQDHGLSSSSPLQIAAPSPSSSRVAEVDQNKSNDDDDDDAFDEAGFQNLFKGSVRSGNGHLLFVHLSQSKVLRSKLISASPGLNDVITQEVETLIKLIVYSPDTSSQKEFIIQGKEDLLQVLGPAHQALAAFDDILKLVRTIIQSRFVIDDTATGNVSGSELKRSRLFKAEKITPTMKTLDSDELFNQSFLIQSKSERGLKLFSRALIVGGQSIILTLFEIPNNAIRFQVYDTVTGAQTRHVLQSDSIQHILKETTATEKDVTSMSGKRNRALKLLAQLEWSKNPSTGTLGFCPIDLSLPANTSETLSSVLPNSSYGRILFYGGHKLKNNRIIISKVSSAQPSSDPSMKEDDVLHGVHIDLYESSTGVRAEINIPLTVIKEAFLVDQIEHIFQAGAGMMKVFSTELLNMLHARYVDEPKPHFDVTIDSEKERLKKAIEDYHQIIHDTDTSNPTPNAALHQASLLLEEILVLNDKFCRIKIIGHVSEQKSLLSIRILLYCPSMGSTWSYEIQANQFHVYFEVGSSHNFSEPLIRKRCYELIASKRVTFDRIGIQVEPFCSTS